ncbi:MAG TPA: phosphoribosylanthranilate isomerase [Gemmatimonadaceae bacterium]|nr:phosphoribosylanthranilate isomerase [Gemmatimonadaceae bacterium]
MVEIKFCGLTRPDDAGQVAALGGSYAGVIFAGGPRHLDAPRAAEVLAAVDRPVRRVGVFAAHPPDEIARIVEVARLDIVQLHGDPTPEHADRVHAVTGALVWTVVRIGSALPPALAELDGVAEAIVVDALVQGRLGGTGTAFDWSVLPPEARPRRSRLVAAGGLSAETVGAAISALTPHVVDVSSGVERAPGLKDHERMRAFADAVRRHTVER